MTLTTLYMTKNILYMMKTCFFVINLIDKIHLCIH
jgi:hypothetical protein